MNIHELQLTALNIRLYLLVQILINGLPTIMVIHIAAVPIPREWIGKPGIHWRLLVHLVDAFVLHERDILLEFIGQIMLITGHLGRGRRRQLLAATILAG